MLIANSLERLIFRNVR